MDFRGERMIFSARALSRDEREAALVLGEPLFAGDEWAVAAPEHLHVASAAQCACNAASPDDVDSGVHAIGVFGIRVENIEFEHVQLAAVATLAHGSSTPRLCGVAFARAWSPRAESATPAHDNEVKFCVDKLACSRDCSDLATCIELLAEHLGTCARSARAKRIEFPRHALYDVAYQKCGINVGPEGVFFDVVNAPEVAS